MGKSVVRAEVPERALSKTVHSRVEERVAFGEGGAYASAVVDVSVYLAHQTATVS